MGHPCGTVFSGAFLSPLGVKIRLFFTNYATMNKFHIIPSINTAKVL